MKHTHNRAGIAAITLIVATVFCSLTLASASEQVDKKGNTGIPIVPTEKKESAPEKNNTKSDKTSTKPEEKEIPKAVKPARHRRLNKARKEVLPPDARLTVTQVMELLKTTRDFSGRNLSGLHLVGLDLSGCNFRGADLSNGNLERTNLDEAVLERADLSGANMKMSDLRLTGMKGARLERALLDGAIWQDGTICAKNSVGYCREL
jgi:hypothetical protein